MAYCQGDMHLLSLLPELFAYFEYTNNDAPFTRLFRHANVSIIITAEVHFHDVGVYLIEIASLAVRTMARECSSRELTITIA